MLKKTLWLGGTALFILFLVTIFGDNLRRSFGMSADALAGDDRLERKQMRAFGQNNAYDAPAAPGAMPAVTAAPEPEPKEAPEGPDEEAWG